ncbi:hypothetical protein B1s21160_01365 [Candidatus Nanopelagicus hibericus]|uniref:DoxX family protein n=1 Tax=Candidatus Nanopelagicus hibericus TaxID=1884915 RepID=A0A249K8A5_9ACTN|nr:hypothetical protein [Candidatus Nanopelagicus hibericus]ASY13008.1 hypothetical protein B1s21160_01365 [Candidatus Nanopelagicus hibericus]
MKFDFKKLLPNNPTSFEGFRAIRIVTAIYMLVMVVRSCIHLFAADGGAQSIAGIDTSVAGGDNIIAIFHQWGAIQLILAVLLFVLFFRYPGLTPLILLTLALDPVMRFIAGQMMSVTSTGTPPGEALNGASFYLLALLFIASLAKKN